MNGQVEVADSKQTARKVETINHSPAYRRAIIKRISVNKKIGKK